MRTSRVEPRVWLAAVFSLLAACQHPGPSGAVPEIDKALDTSAAATTAPAVPNDVSNALVPGLRPPAGATARKAEEPRFDIAVSDLPEIGRAHV